MVTIGYNPPRACRGSEVRALHCWAPSQGPLRMSAHDHPLALTSFTATPRAAPLTPHLSCCLSTAGLETTDQTHYSSE